MNQAALFTGINKYKNYPEDTLRGCVADANDLRQLIQMGLQFTMDECAILTDGMATKQGLLSGLNLLVQELQTGNLGRAIWTFSGHGTQVPDLDGDEPDGMDEALCCHDIAEKDGDWDRTTILVDDEISQILSVLPITCLLEIIFDCCHASTGLKEMGRRHAAARYIPNPLAENPAPALLGRRLMQQRRQQNVVLWAACRADQTSADAYIASGWHGAFAYYFCKLWTLDKPRSVLLQDVTQALKTEGYSQVPTIECSDRLMELPVGDF